MKKRKLIIMLSIIFLLLVICAVVIFFCTNHKNDSDNNEIKKNENGMYNVPVSSWNDPYSRYIICEIENNDISTNFTDAFATFNSKLTLDELAEQNDDFIGKTTYYLRHLEYDANLYFSDNNYYVIYHVPKTEQVDEYYKALCMSITINSNTDIPRVTLPFPMYLSLTPNIVNSHNEKSEKYVDYFFDRFTFEDSCEFYERYTNGVAEIDYDNKLIYVDAREKNSERTYHEKYLCIDFVNRRFICDKDGENEVVFE